MIREEAKEDGHTNTVNEENRAGMTTSMGHKKAQQMDQSEVMRDHVNE
jgi:hypothetical protein